jgi:hypothetical protein
MLQMDRNAPESQNRAQITVVIIKDTMTPDSVGAEILLEL